jgi:hypothetical protein
MIQTNITVDDQPITLHQHISALTQVDKSYTPQNVLNFNYNSIKNIFENKIPLCFKQCIVLLAYSRQEPEILSLGFENSEFEEVKALLINELDAKKLNHA